MEDLKTLFAEFTPTDPEGFANNDPDLRNSSNRITILPKNIRLWKPLQGEQSHIRFLPNLGRSYFAEETRGHYRVGTAGHSFGCPNMKREDCPMCEFAKAKYIQASEIDDTAKADEIKAIGKDYNGVIYHYAYIIDRKHPGKGVQAYAMTNYAMETIRAQLTDENGKVFSVDDPINGYDIFFTLPKQEKFAKIEAVKIARNPSSVTYDPVRGEDHPELAAGWVKFIKDHPLSKIINFIPKEEIKKLAFGTVASTPSESARVVDVDPINAGNAGWEPTPIADEAYAKSLADSSVAPSTSEAPKGEDDFEAKMAEMQRRLAEA